MPYKLQIFWFCKECQYFTIIIKKLFLWWYSSSSKFFLKKFKQFFIFFWCNRFLRFNKFVIRTTLSFRLALLNILYIYINVTQINWFKTYIKEFFRILITIIYSYRSSTYTNIKPNSKISWFKWHSRTILFNNNISFEECALWCSTIDHLWLSNHNRSVLEEIVNYQFSNSIIF